MFYRCSILLILLTTLTWATKLHRFDKITPDNGLSASQVLSITSDNYGFIWIGTLDGLNRYDGYNIKVYQENENDSTSIKGKVIKALYVDSDGVLWVGTEKGLNRYNVATDNFTFVEDASSTSPKVKMGAIESITSDDEGNIWAGGANLYEIKKSDLSIKEFKYNSNDKNSLIAGTINCLVYDNNKHLWLATSNGLDEFNINTDQVNHFNKYNHPEIIPTSFVRGLGIDKNNNLWVNSDSGYIARVNLNNFSDYKLYNICAKVPYLENNAVKNIVFDKDGDLWAGHGNGGILMYNPRTDKFTRYQRSINNPYGLNNDAIWTIYIDKAGNIWVGTFSGGVNVAYKYNQAILRYSSISGNPNTLSYNNVTSFVQDHNGNIWIGTDGGGLNMFDPKTQLFKVYNTSNSGIGSNAVLGVTESEPGIIWCANWAGGLNKLNTKTGKIKSYNTKNSNLPIDHFFGVYTDSKGRLWASYFNGLVLYDKAHDSFINYPIDPSNPLRWVLVSIYEDSNGLLWVTSQKGLHIFNPETKQYTNIYASNDFTKSIPGNFVTSVRQSNTDKNIYWIGTHNGLSRYDKSTGTYERISTDNGLPSNNIKAIEIDKTGDLWISTNRGLCRYNPETKNVTLFKKSDGLQGNEYKDGSSMETKTGELFFGGMSGGFNCFYPNDIKENTFLPNVVITNFKLFNKSVGINTKNSPLKKNIMVTKEINLNYNQSVISFDFTSLNMEAASENQYAYMMKGFDKNWIYCGNKKSASYTNLPPGHYVFRVKGSNNNNIWNVKGASIQIYIAPPFWGTWWFRILVLLIIIGAVYYYLKRSKEKRLYLENINKQLNDEIKHSKEAEEEKMRLAQEASAKDEEAKRILEEQKRYLDESVNILLSEMKEFSEGNLTVNIEQNSNNDSIEQLFNGFNRSVENIRKIIKSIIEAIEKNVKASDSICQSAHKMSQGAIEQNNRSNEVAAAVEEMTANIVESGRFFEMVVNASKDAADIAQKGGTIVTDTIEGISKIYEVVNQAVATVQELGNSGNEIGEIVQLIEEIADQTNLLALNAAIEAARAGEYGRGFAVVAEEVKKLSERTTKATKDIADKIRRIQKETQSAVVSISKGIDTVNQGKEHALKAGDSLGDIIKSADKVNSLIEQVATANEQQSTTAEHISKSINMINDVSKETAVDSEYVSNASNELKNVALALHKMIQQFKLETEEANTFVRKNYHGEN